MAVELLVVSGDTAAARKVDRNFDQLVCHKTRTYLTTVHDGIGWQRSPSWLGPPARPSKDPRDQSGELIQDVVFACFSSEVLAAYRRAGVAA